MTNADSQNTMQIILIAVLLLCGYLALLRYMHAHTANRSAFPLLAVFLLLIYGGVSGGVTMILMQMGTIETTFMGFLMLGACITVFLMLAYLLRHHRDMHKGWVLIFFLYTVSVGYITVFSRNGGNDTSILGGFTSIEEAISTHSIEPLNHMLLNVVLFVPFGFLFPMMEPENLNKLLIVIPVGAMTSVTIESVQLMMRLGQCDLEDIVANTLGGVIGLLLYRLYMIVFHRDEYEGYEEDEEDEEEEEA